jgi:hypothetical protein
MRQLRGDEHAPVAARRHRPLPLQRLRTLLQDERPEQTSHQAQTKIGECKNPTNFIVFAHRRDYFEEFTDVDRSLFQIK